LLNYSTERNVIGLKFDKTGEWNEIISHEINKKVCCDTTGSGVPGKKLVYRNVSCNIICIIGTYALYSRR